MDKTAIDVGNPARVIKQFGFLIRIHLYGGGKNDKTNRKNGYARQLGNAYLCTVKNCLTLLLMMLSSLAGAAQSGTTDNTMNDKQQIALLYEDMLRYMIAKDTVSLGALLSDDSVLVHMTGHRQSKGEYLREIASGVLNYYSAQTDSIDITVDGDKARLVGRSRVNAAVYGGGRHTWPLQMDSRLERICGQWKIVWTKASTY